MSFKRSVNLKVSCDYSLERKHEGLLSAESYKSSKSCFQQVRECQSRKCAASCLHFFSALCQIALSSLVFENVYRDGCMCHMSARHVCAENFLRNCCGMRVVMQLASTSFALLLLGSGLRNPCLIAGIALGHCSLRCCLTWKFLSHEAFVGSNCIAVNTMAIVLVIPARALQSWRAISLQLSLRWHKNQAEVTPDGRHSNLINTEWR